MAHSPKSHNLSGSETSKAHASAGVWVKRSVAAILVLALVLITAVALAITLVDWNRARPWVNERVSNATGRYFEVRGNLDAHWIWPQPLDHGWRHWVPGVLVQADDIALGNRTEFGNFGALSPSDVRDKPPLLKATAVDAEDSKGAGNTEGSTPLMARIASGEATIRLLPLLGHVVLIDSLKLEQADVALARSDVDENNWTFETQRQDETPKSSRWRVDVGQLELSGAQLAYADTAQKLAVRAVVDTDLGDAAVNDTENRSDKTNASVARDAGRYGLSIDVKGRYRDAQLTGSGRAGALLSLRETQVQYPIEFDIKAGSTHATVAGTLSNPRSLNGVDMMVTLSSDSMADLYDLTGLVLPSTPPFETSGHLVGNLEPSKATWDFEDFSGVVGKSDLQGHLSYTSGEPRPKLKGQIKSRNLQLSDLGPVVGTLAADSSRDKKDKRIGKVFPDAPFATDRWSAMDMDIAFLGQKLIGPSALPLDDMSVRAVMTDGALKLSPLRFGVAKGRIDAQVELNGRTDPLKGEIRATVDDLRLSALFPKVELLDKSFGRMDGAFALSGTGNSIASLLAKSNGESRVYIRDGTFSQQLLDLAALNLGSVVVGKLFGADKEVKLRCAVADLSIKNGMAQTRSVKLSTNEAVVEAVGTLDLNREYMDLRIKPESLEWKFLSLRTPLHVRGPFIKPEVGVEAGPLLARAGAAVVAAIVAPAALALIPITVPAAEDDAECAKLLARADEAVKAGPSGAKAKPPASATAQ